MHADSEQNTDDHATLKQERDVFKKQFLKTQQNYENKIKELSVLKELGNTLGSTNFYDEQEFFGGQLDIIRRYTARGDISLMLLNEELQTLQVVARTDKDEPIGDHEYLRLDEGGPGQSIVEKVPVVVDSPQDVFPKNKQGGPPDDGSMLCVPVLHNKKAIGVLCLRQEGADSFDQNQVRFLSLVADQIATAVILFRIYHQMLREERHRLLLSRFFSSTVTEKIFGSGENLRLGGERTNVTILFADLQGFTSMSENLDQEEVVEILNAFFSRMTPIIFKHDGTLDKLMGDGILAFFGAPIPHEDDPLRAVMTAMDMMKALREFNANADGKKRPILRVSIGINSGEVVAGYIGSEDHLNYTVIGDAVNVAQRLESSAGPDEILISKAVQKQVQGGLTEEHGLKAVVPLPPRKVKGKEKAIEVFRVELQP